MDLTERQRAVFDFLKDYRRRFRRSPSYEEIRRHFGFGSLNSVRKHLQQLERKGYIRTPWGNRKRALELVADKVDPPPTAERIPLTGHIKGEGVLEWTGTSETVEVPASLLKPGEHYALSVSGDAFAAQGLLDGDILVVRRWDTARPGQLVVARVGDGAALTRIGVDGAQITRDAASPPAAAHPPGPRPQVSLLGVCVALIRRYD